MNTIHDRYRDCRLAVQASPVHSPMAPMPILKANRQATGRPSPQYMPRLMVAPIFCRPQPRSTPARTVLAPSPAGGGGGSHDVCSTEEGKP